MTIIVILAAVGVTAYQHIQLKARETILKQDLQTMRKMIDQYAADKEKLPSSLDDLATAGYIREVPIDPMTGQKDWVVDMGEDTVSRDGGTGVVDGNIKVRVGASLSLAGLGPFFEGSYYVTRARHSFTLQYGWRTTFDAERPGIGG